MKTNTWGGPQRSPPFRLPCTTSRRFLICIPSSKEFGSRSLQGLNSKSHFLFPMHPTPPLCSPFSAGLGRERGWGGRQARQRPGAELPMHYGRHGCPGSLPSP